MSPPPSFATQICAQISRIYLSAEARKIVEIVDNDRSRVQNFAEAIGAEPLFAARLLRVANFAPGLTHRLSSLDDAVNVLGLDNLKPLALALTGFALDGSPNAQDFLDEHQVFGLLDLWEHALGTATIAGRFATRVGSVAPVTAFVGGFIHDIGKVFLARYAHDRYCEALVVAREKMLPSTEAETLALGMDHVQAGQEWSHQSHLAPAFDQVVRLHHLRLAMLPAEVDESGRRLIAVVQLADAVCEAEAIGRGGDRRASLGELHDMMGFRSEDWNDALRAIKEEIESARPVFGFYKRDAKRPHALRSEPAMAEAAHETDYKAVANGPRRVVIPFPSRGIKKADSANSAPEKLAILVVEDHSSLCDLLSLYFMRHGYHVRTANDGESALEVLAREDIHLVLLDLMLPRVDGFEVLRQIHLTHGEKAPYIIVVSAGASERDRKKVLELGANEYMPKPFHLLRLLERVQAVEKFLR